MAGGKTYLIIPDTHAHPDHHNKRADWLGRLILDLRPDAVVHLGDGPDMPSLSGYDKGKKSFQGRTYQRDVNAWLDFQDRMWHPLKKAKKKYPKRYYLVGNHEERIHRAVNIQPELEGAIGLQDLDLDRYWDNIVDYRGTTPGVITLDGIAYAHYFITGISGRGISGEHPAYSLLTKMFMSCTMGHSHVLDFCVRTDAEGRMMRGLNAGIYQDYDSDWAGECNSLWWRGVVIKRAVENGNYDLQTININELKRVYNR